MLYKYFNNKKGFSMVEILIVVIVMSILLAVAVPIFDTGLRKQKEDDCRNQCLVIETAVKQAMFGMIDNGKKQTMKVNGKDELRIDFSKPAADGFKTTFTDKDGADHNAFKLTGDANCFTLGALRGGYRDISVYPEYKEGCDKSGCFLKKQALANIEFYKYLDNQEVPVCPFADDDNSQGYYYYVLEDGSVHCTCELDDDK